MSTDELNPCPLCGEPLYGWIALPAAGGEASVGMPLSALPNTERVLDRCEKCGVAIERGREVDLAAEWEAVCRARDSGGARDRDPQPRQPPGGDRGRGLGGDRPLARQPAADPGQPRAARRAQRRAARAAALAPLGPRAGLDAGRPCSTASPSTPTSPARYGPGACTDDGRGALRFYADAIVTVLGAPLVALVSFPLELVGALARRGGEMFATTTRVS